MSGVLIHSNHRVNSQGLCGRPTCDLDEHGGLIVARHVLCLHCDLVNARTFIAMLDGLICHCQILVDGPKPVSKVHLVLGATGVALSEKEHWVSAHANRIEGLKRRTALFVPAPGGQ